MNRIIIILLLITLAPLSYSQLNVDDISFSIEYENSTFDQFSYSYDRSTGNLLEELKSHYNLNGIQDTVNKFCYNQYSWFNQDCYCNLYSMMLPNRWFENGKPKSILSYSIESKSIVEYKHYNVDGELIGKELFYNDVINDVYLRATGKWWKLDSDGNRIEYDPNEIDLIEFQNLIHNE